MDAPTFGQHPVLDFLVLPAVAVRNGLADRARAHLHREGDDMARTRLMHDDAAAAPFAVSPLILRPLSAATLILDTVLNAAEQRDERFPAVIRDYGIYPLVCAGMMHAARAIYLLRPLDRAERIGRLLTLAYEDVALMRAAQNALGACTCEIDDIGRAAELVADERQQSGLGIATDAAVLADAAEGSAFGQQILGLYDAFNCSARALPEPLLSITERPLTLQTPWGDRNLVVQLEEMQWVAIAALADLVSVGWQLADLDEEHLSDVG